MPDAAAPFGWSSSQHLIAYVDLAIAERATPEMLGLGQSRSADLFAHEAPARLWLVDGHDRGHVHLSKK